MNIENIKKAIAIMERAKAAGSVNMREWQSTLQTNTVNTEEELHKCGNQACFAGHIAVSPEFQNSHGSVSVFGSPLYQVDGVIRSGHVAIAAWLEVDTRTSSALVHEFDHIYPVRWSEVQAEHVIDKLTELLEIGEKQFMTKYDI